MAYCVKCGARVEDDLRFCPYCGAEIPRTETAGNTADSMYTAGGNSDSAQSYTYYQGEAGGQQGSTYNNSSYQYAGGYFDASEVKRSKGMGVLSYLGILVLIPLLAGDKTSAYVKHHINQGLTLFIVSSIVDFLDGKWLWGLHFWSAFGGDWLSWIIDILDFGCLILLIMGIVSACKGTRQELPIVGKIKILK